MESYCESLLIKEWEDFNQIIAEKSTLKPVTLQKWKRHGDLRFLNGAELIHKRVLNRDLLKAAKPYLEHLSLNFFNKPHLVVLTDSEGWVLFQLGSANLLERMDNLKSGINWSIDSLGDNGVGLVLNDSSPALVYGIMLDQEPGVSLGIPIKGEDGSMVGVLGVIVQMKDARSANLSFALTSVGFVEKALIAAHNMHSKLSRVEKFMSLGSGMATAVHDLKNPLANIRAISQLGAMNAKEIKASEYFQRIITNIDNLSEMLNTLMKTYRSEEMLVDSPGTIIEDVMQDLEPICKIQNINLTLTIEDRPRILLQPGVFKRLMQNLLGNAVEAMSDGGDLEVSVAQREEKILITIRDTGPGIPENVQEAIFEPFVHGRSEGIGLGLYMVYSAVTEVHNGRIWYETGPESGTTFFIQLPINEG